MTDIMFAKIEQSLRDILLSMNKNLVAALSQAQTGDVESTEKSLTDFNSNSQKLVLIMKSAEAVFDKPNLNKLAAAISPEIAEVTKTKKIIDELLFYGSLQNPK